MSRTHELDPPAVGSGSDYVDFIHSVVSVLRFPEETSGRIERQSKAVSMTVREDLANIGSHVGELICREANTRALLQRCHLLDSDIGEGIVRGRGAIRVETEDGAG